MEAKTAIQIQVRDIFAFFNVGVFSLLCHILRGLYFSLVFCETKKGGVCQGEDVFRPFWQNISQKVGKMLFGI